MTLTGLLLAGGLSRRMGVDKAVLEIAGLPLWLRQLNTLRELNPFELWLSIRDSTANAGSKPSWCPEDVHAIFDSSPSVGPLSGITAALRQLRTTHLLVLAIDMPAMTSGPLRSMWELAKPGCGVVPRTEGSWEPLAAVYPKEALPLTEAALLSNDFSLQTLCQNLFEHQLVHPYAIPPTDLPLYGNLNTPSDLSR